MIRKAALRDAPDILRLVNDNARRGLMLAKSPYDIYRNILEFIVYVDDKTGTVVGCSRLAVLWKDIGEVASLAVDDRFKRMGIGRELVKKCIETAKEIGLPKVISLTYQNAFFESVGFKRVNRENLPHKVFSDCIHCPKVDNCDECAYEFNIG